MKLFSINTKRIITVAIVCILVLSFTACEAPENEVVASLGEYDNREFFTSGGFQDYTDYAKYYYSSAQVTDNNYFKKIQETDLETIYTHLDDFEGWIDTIKTSDASNEVAKNYCFDRVIIDTGDYFYIDSEEKTWNDGHTSLVSYDIYLLDSQSQILYYFHNNI